MGLMKEESIEFLGQGWFRSAWEMYVEEIPDYDEDEETWGFEESVVLKTLRCAFVCMSMSSLSLFIPLPNLTGFHRRIFFTCADK
jgi:hypothetical protein